MPGAASPTLILIPWANNASSSYVTSPIPEASQQPNPRASYTDGFPPQTVGLTATAPPDVRDFNGGLKDATSNIVAWTAGQYWPFNASVASQNGGYAGGAIIATADGSGFWLNASAGNSNNPDTAPAASSGWMPLAQYGSTAITGLTNANVTLTGPQAAKPIITLSGDLTGNVQIIFPTWASRWIVVNLTTGNYAVTCKTSGGTGVIVPQLGWYGPAMLVSDGTNIQNAFGARGVFTGTMTGPFSSGVSVNINWSISGSFVTLTVANDTLASTSSSAVITLSGLPSFLYPSALRQVTITNLCDANEQPCLGQITVNPTGAVSIAPYSSVTAGATTRIVPTPFILGGSSGTGMTAGATASYQL